MTCVPLLPAFGFILLASPVAAQTGFPFTNEDLNYSINWPSGLSLGEGHLHARKLAPDRWQFELSLDAGIPGFTLTDRYRSTAAGDLCSAEFEKEATHGSRKVREKTVFDSRKGVAKRSTLNGGKSELPISGCGRDALDYIFYARRELGQGRVPPAQTVLFGAAYQVRMEYTGAQTVTVSDKRVESDRLVVSTKGPASETSFEIFFARDAARTPLLVRVPFSIGTVSMELVR